MCHYRVTTFRCGHTRKRAEPPCHNNPPGCHQAHELAELTDDLGLVRAGIRTCNIGQRDLGEHARGLLARIRAHYPSWFGRGSGNGERTLESLRQLEAYLEGEIAGIGAPRATVRVRSEGYCFDSCWEATVAMGMEGQLRRFHPQGPFGG